MNRRVTPTVNVRQLLGQSREQIAPYGNKTAGYLRLLEAQKSAPYPFYIPSAWAIPMASAASLDSAGIERAFTDLTQGLSRRGVLMARSSAANELPGQAPTLCTPFDPTDRQASHARFRQAIEAVHSISDDMGVLATLMVGQELLLNNRHTFGWDNVSFVADTHSAINSAEIYLSVVHGLGTRAVDTTIEHIPIVALRDSGLLVHLGNKSERFLTHQLASITPVSTLPQYRQQSADLFDLEWGEFITYPITEQMIAGATPMTVVNGEVYAGTQVPIETKGPKDSLFLTPKGPYGTLPLGVTPFHNPAMLTKLLAITQHLASHIGPGQIEGAFARQNFRAAIPHLYQWLDLPPRVTTSQPLSLKGAQINTQVVIGHGRFEGPLLFSGEFFPDLQKLKVLDVAFGQKGYTLLDTMHTRQLIAASPHCKRRISILDMNLASHVVCLTRLRLADNPNSGHLLAMRCPMSNTKFTDGIIGGIPADEQYGGFYIFQRTISESNGEQYALKILTA